MRYLFALLVLLSGCKKNNSQKAECIVPTIVPFQPYSYPVWHPNGNLLGFNHRPLAAIVSNGSAPCIWYSYLGKVDSTGFYLMKKDGSGFRRVTNFMLFEPSWSPDGNWIAFSLGSNIYKMPFSGSTFDTAQIEQLTSVGGNFYPAWTADSDTIYFDSNNDAPAGTSFYSIWKMASDGSGKTGFPNTGREPFVGSDNRVYYMGFQAEVFSMSKDGSNQIQLTFNGNISGSSTTKSSPEYYNGKIFYQQNGLWVLTNSTPAKLDSPCVTYNISPTGEIVYSKTDYDITKYNKQIGTLWIMNADGSNKRQLTFNNL